MYFPPAGLFGTNLGLLPRCIHHRGVENKYEEILEYSKKIEIFPG
jgi:hypothetical protein